MGLFDLKTLWTSKANGDGPNGNGGGRDMAEPQPDHYCQEHQVAFKRHEKGGSVWYSHKAGERWCNER